MFWVKSGFKDSQFTKFNAVIILDNKDNAVLTLPIISATCQSKKAIEKGYLSKGVFLYLSFSF
jgi:hypothetical protein